MPNPRVTDEQRRKILEAVGKGAHPQVACTAVGLSQSYFRVLRFRARNGDLDAQTFCIAIETAAAQAELDNVDATNRAIAPFEEKTIVCPHCEAEYVADPEQLAVLAMRVTDMAKAKAQIADVALKVLERRHPVRWSQKIIPVQDQHERLLDVAERVLEREVFESLLEAFLADADGGSESETPGRSSGPAEGGIH
jgi:hypothetical protein